MALCGLGIRAVLGNLSGEQVGGNVGGIQVDCFERRGFGQLRIHPPQGPRPEVREAVVGGGQRARGGVRGGGLRMEFVRQEGGAERRPAVRRISPVVGTPVRARRITSATSGSLWERSGSGGSGRSGPPLRRTKKAAARTAAAAPSQRDREAPPRRLAAGLGEAPSSAGGWRGGPRRSLDPLGTRRVFSPRRFRGGRERAIAFSALRRRRGAG